MKRTLKEREVLRRLGINDFRHMTKDKVIEFATMLNQMDPEVAKKALEQFPNLTEYALTIFETYRKTQENVLNSNQASNQAVMNMLDSVLKTLQKQLEDGNLSVEEKQVFIDKMVEVLKMAQEQDQQNKKFLKDIANKALAGTIFLVSIAAAAIGVRSAGKSPNYSDENVIDVKGTVIEDEEEKRKSKKKSLEKESL